MDALGEKLRADSPLIRLLVIHAIGRRHLHLEPELIACLKDPIPEVRQGARQALIRVAHGTDFGPLPGWSRVGIERSIERWQQWLALQQAAPLAQSRPMDKPTPGNPAQATAVSPGLMIEKVLAPSAATLETVDPRTVALSAELARARDDEQAEVLTRLRDAKGVEHTDALALAIPQLSGDVRDQARAALVQRLARMTAKTLRAKFDEDDVEVRRAAALACGRKGAQEHIPDLLELLNDPESAVVQAARRALKDLTGRDFGPEAGAGPGAHARAVAAWYDWWRKRPADER
jgi:HEAT repeat protein